MPKRGTDHTWQLVKYKHDAAVYAKCKCGFHYNCGRSKIEEDGTWSAKQYPTVMYLYCPHCGARKKWMTEETIRLDKYEWDEMF